MTRKAARILYDTGTGACRGVRQVRGKLSSTFGAERCQDGGGRVRSGAAADLHLTNRD